MRILLTCVTPLMVAGLLGGQDRTPSGQPGKEQPKNAVEFKGEAKVSVHLYKMEKGALYRISAKGVGFTPEVRIDGLNDPSNPTSGLQNVVRGKFEQGQVIFAPTQTKEYRIKVDFVPGTDLGKGPHSYTLTIERAQFKPHTAAADNELSVSENTYKMETGKAYSIAVTGRGFEPDVQIMDAGKSKQSAFNNGKALGFGNDAEYVTNLTFVPTRTADYRIMVAVGPYSKPRSGPLAYTTKVSEMKPDLLVSTELTLKEPRYPQRGGPFKVHTVKLHANKKYQIDMISALFDAYLFLEDSAGNVLTSDDDGGEGLNARIIFTPAKTDTYRVIATTFDRGVPGTTRVGPYTLMVMENPNAVPRFVAPPKKP